MSSHWATVTRAVTVCESAVIFIIYAVFLFLLGESYKSSQNCNQLGRVHYFLDKCVNFDKVGIMSC